MNKFYIKFTIPSCVKLPVRLINENGAAAASSSTIVLFNRPLVRSQSRIPHNCNYHKFQAALPLSISDEMKSSYALLRNAGISCALRFRTFLIQSCHFLLNRSSFNDVMLARRRYLRCPVLN